MTYDTLISTVPTDKRAIVDAYIKGVAEGLDLAAPTGKPETEQTRLTPSTVDWNKIQN